MWKFALFLGLTAVSLLAFAMISKRSAGAKRLSLFLAGLCAFAAMMLGRLTVPAADVHELIEQFRPVQVAKPSQHDEAGYVSSETCKECHQGQFASWHASYHRTMTQLATPETVIGDFENANTDAYGHQITLSRRDDVFWATMHDPEQPVRGDDSVIDRPIVMTTGSHHMQVYWYASGKDRRVGQLPTVWLKETQSWVPIHSIFLRPTQTHLGSAEGRWNSTCIKCHVTQGRPRIDSSQVTPVDTQVAEFGIACEACHGPGAEHVEAQRNNSGIDTSLIVNPSDLDHRRSSEVCGQCHGVWIARDPQEAENALSTGLTYRPGDNLYDTRHVFHSGQTETEHVKNHLAKDPDFYRDRFWDDGMVRVSGREYNGLIQSPCFQRGTMSCTSCHDLHSAEFEDEDWANDQLGKGMRQNHACLQCHEEYAKDGQLTSHTHHRADSSGSLCYNCHMPHTTYGLLKAIRSHQVSSPSVTETVEFGRPNACNQCHIDQSLSWASSSLEEWYGVPSPPLTQDQQNYSATLLAALSGDAGQRALAAWSLGWDAAHRASSTDWIEPILAHLMNDPYHTVRLVAHRSLMQLPGYQDFAFDFLADDQTRKQRVAEILDRWSQKRNSRSGNAALLIDSSGGLALKEFNDLIEKRDNRTVVLAE